MPMQRAYLITAVQCILQCGALTAFESAYAQERVQQFNLGLGEVSKLGPEQLPFGYAYMPGVWKSSPGQSLRLVVCWENPAAGHAQHRLQVKDALNETWAAAAAIDFVGWHKCSDQDTSSVRISVEDIGPHVKALGSDLGGLQRGVVLNFDFNNWRPEPWCLESPANKKECTKAIVVHEFGHVLSLSHEHNREDTPGECFMMPDGQYGTAHLTSYDTKSIMNYCYQMYRINGFNLSEGDVNSIRMLYGARY